MIPKEDSLWKKFVRYAIGLVLRHDGTPMRLDTGVQCFSFSYVYGLCCLYTNEKSLSNGVR